MTKPIWSLTTLEALLDHSEPSVQKWAVAKLIYLYPEETRPLLPQLLSSPHPAVVEETLSRLHREDGREVIPLLAHLFLSAEESIAAQAIRILGDLVQDEAVGWVKERILQERPMGKDLVASIVYTLGRIGREDAYLLLKEAERTVQEEGSSRWELVCSALLQHRRPEDVAMLVEVAADPNRGDERRREALGLLLGEMDPALNPSNVFFINHGEVHKHWGKLMGELEAEAERKGMDPGTEPVKELLARLDPKRIDQSPDLLAQLGRSWGEESAFEKSVFRCSLEKAASNADISEEARYGLICLAVAAFLKRLEERVFAPPAADAGWEEKLRYVLRNRPLRPEDDLAMAEVVARGDRNALVDAITATLESRPEEWGALRAVVLIGELRAAEAVGAMLKALAKAGDSLFVDAVRKVLLRVGVPALPLVVDLVTSPRAPERMLAVEILGKLPVAQGLAALSARLEPLYRESAEVVLNAIYEAGSREFLTFLEEEYRPGEWQMGRVYLHLCRLNELQPERLREIERTVKHAERFQEDQSRMFSGEKAHWPSSVELELVCGECGKKYHYDVREVHLHPHARSGQVEEEESLVPYHHGVVICDDLRCKNCRALNTLRLTQKTLAQLAAESVKILAFRRTGLNVPADYPVKHVQVEEKAGKPLTLLQIEQDHLSAARATPAKPSVHLVLAKFYEYVKEHDEAKRSYLQAMNLDARAVEAMAGLARLAHAEGKMEEANLWIQACYEYLEKGHFYVTQDLSEFKKAVREKRIEFARESGNKPKETPVQIQFSIETAPHSKNKPCPCGSGKKFKQCCMKKLEGSA